MSSERITIFPVSVTGCTCLADVPGHWMVHPVTEINVPGHRMHLLSGCNCLADYQAIQWPNLAPLPATGNQDHYYFSEGVSINGVHTVVCSNSKLCNQIANTTQKANATRISESSLSRCYPSSFRDHLSTIKTRATWIAHNFYTIRVDLGTIQVQLKPGYSSEPNYW